MSEISHVLDAEYSSNYTDEIKFTQFIRPHGRRKTVYVKRPEEIVSMAKKCILRGATFTVEKIGENLISLACEWTLPEQTEEMDIVVKISRNDEQILGKVDQLVKKSYEIIFQG